LIELDDEITKKAANAETRMQRLYGVKVVTDSSV